MKNYVEQLRADIADLDEMIEAAKGTHRFKDATDLMEKRRLLIAELRDTERGAG